MGYQIKYEGGLAIKTTAQIPKRRKLFSVVGIMTALVAVILCWSGGQDAVSELLLPGDEAVTAQALQGLVEDLQEGTSVAYAVEAFCQEIIYHEG